MKNAIMILGLLFVAFVALLFFLRLLAKPPENLGVSQGRLAPCPNMPNCVSSQVEDESHFLEPLHYGGSRQEAMAKLTGVINDMPRTRIVVQTDSYMHVEFATSGIPRWTDDVEFYIPPEGQVIHFRSASRIGYSDWGKNKRRMLEIRQRFDS